MSGMRLTGPLACLLLAASGCYNWHLVPAGVQQRTLDLQVAGLMQRYTVLAPAPSAATARRAAVVLLHAGFGGDETTSARLARQLAQRGLAVVLPAYRGEKRKLDGQRSDGKIEFCRGEVDDAQAALQWLRRQPDIDGQRIGALGSSHGGCIALRLGEREPELRALVTFSAPVAAGPFIEHLENHPAQTLFYNGILATQIKSYVKTTPKEHPELYEERSPLSKIAALKIPLLVFHGIADHIVPMEQPCSLYQALAQSGRQIEESRINRQGEVSKPDASACPQAGGPPNASSVSVPTRFIFMEGQGHFYARQVQRTAAEIAVNFLAQELRP